MIERNHEKAQTLIEALPFIKRFFGKTVVIQYGSSLMRHDHGLPRFAADVALLKCVGMKPVIVHGGGPEISRWLQRMGKDRAAGEGPGLTDSEAMEITEMVVSGKVNSEIVSLINQQGARAVGVSGKDAELLQAEKPEPGGDTKSCPAVEALRVNGEFLTTLTESGYVPVVSSVGLGRSGETLSLDADPAAAAVAIALKALKLIYVTEVDGVLREGTLINALTRDEARALLQRGAVTGAMRAKVECAVQALEQGVREVHLINGLEDHAVLLELFTAVGIGTMLSDGE